jgi:hypothetical protein
MDAGRNFPAAAAFLVTTTTFFQFPVRTGARAITSSLSTSAPARGITQNLVVFSAAKRLQILCDVIQPGKIEARLNHFSLQLAQYLQAFPLFIGDGRAYNVKDFASVCPL